MSTRVDVIVVVSAIEKDMATERTEIAKLRNKAFGDPRSRVSSSDSDISNIESSSRRARRIAGASDSGLLDDWLGIASLQYVYGSTNGPGIPT